MSNYIPPRVKICGITSVEDALAAANAGADAIGLVFYKPSPRCIDIATARNIINAVGPFVTTVALFVDEEVAVINGILNEIPLQLLQFHGDESPEFCEQFSRPYLKALRMKPDVDIFQVASEYTSAQGLLLDAYRPGVPGGTGETFDWDRVPQAKDNLASVSADQIPPILLAGGLTPENVQQAVQQTKPYAVDVSGGVESSPGKKDSQKILDFIRKAKTSLGE